MDQLYFNFSNLVNKSKQDIIVGPHNKEVFNFLFVDKIPFKFLYVYGNEKVGKSALTSLYALENSGKVLLPKDFTEVDNSSLLRCSVILIEDIESFNKDSQYKLFDLYNLLINSDSQLVLTANKDINSLNFVINDLVSRLQTFVNFYIKEPEDEYFRIIIFKMLQDKNLNIDIKVVDYLLKRIKRSAKEANFIIEKIIEASFKSNKRITISFLQNLGI